MDKSKGEPVISVKAASRSKDRVSVDRQGWASLLSCPGTAAWPALAEMAMQHATV